jgi:hypothetical protein
MDSKIAGAAQTQDLYIPMQHNFIKEDIVSNDLKYNFSCICTKPMSTLDALGQHLLSCQVMDASYGDLIQASSPYFEQNDRETLSNFDCILSLLLDQISGRITAASGGLQAYPVLDLPVVYQPVQQAPPLKAPPKRDYFAEILQEDDSQTQMIIKMLQE